MKKKFALCLAVAVTMISSFLLAGCGGGSDANNTFKIGMECGYAPYNWTQNDDSNGAVKIENADGYANGYDVQIAKKIADGLGKELVIVKTKWEGLIPAVQSGTVDAVIAGMSPTDERKVSVDFTNNYWNSELVLIVKKGSKYENATSLADFAGAKVTAQQGTFHYTVCDQIPNAEVQPAMSDFPAMRVALESGVIDAYVSETPEALSATAANQNFAYIQFAEGNGFTYTKDEAALAVAIKKGSSDLQSQINTIIDGISEEERQQLMNQMIQVQPTAE